MVSHFIILIIVVPLLGAFSIPLVNKFGRRIRNFWLVSVLALTDILSLLFYKSIFEKETFIYHVGAKLPSLASLKGFPVRIILVGDALSGLLVFIFLIIASLAFFYSWKILKGHSSSDKFYILYFLLITGILGFLLVGDFFTLFVFYEINSIATAGLIAFFRNRGCFRSAFHYLAVFAVGSLLLLFGVGLLYGQYGSLNMAIIANSLQFSFLDKVALSLLASALLLKVGFFPFYFWKPEAYKVSPAPAIVLFIISSVSAVYVLFRIAFDIFGPNIKFGWILVTFSILSIFIGVFLALKENNLKKILAYLAISELGYIILGISVGLIKSNVDFGLKAIQGGLFHMVNDILDVGLLFLIVGSIIYVSQTEDVFKIRGLAHRYPALSGFFLLGILATAGMPPLNGFASKIIILESVFHLSPILTIVGILGSILILAVLVKIFVSIFFGAPVENYQLMPKSAIAVISVFAIFIILISLFPKQFVNSFINPAAKALVDRQDYINSVLY